MTTPIASTACVNFRQASKLVLALLAAVTLSGCVSAISSLVRQEVSRFRKYEEPEEGTARAQLRVSIDQTQGNARLYPGHSCMRWQEPRAGWVMTSVVGIPLAGRAYTGRSIGTRGLPEKPGLTTGEVYLVAGEVVTAGFEFVTSAGSSAFSCRPAVSFTPQANRHYQVVAQWVDASQTTACVAQVVEIDEAGAARPVESAPAKDCELAAP